MEDTNQVPSDTQTDDRRAAIEAAFEQVETNEQPTEVVEVDEPVEQIEQEAKPEPVSEATNEEQAPVETEHKEAPTEDKVKTDRAPQSWKPDAREAWADLPEAAKRDIVRREREIATTLQQSAEERRFAQEINLSFKPYEAELRAAGVSPKAVVDDLLNTSYVLRRGQPAQRAEMVARIIEQHGVDLVALNDLLSKPAEANRPDPVAQRVAQLEQVEQQRQRQAQIAHETQLNKMINDFAADPKNEFFQHVMPLMVTFLESNQSATLAEAYEKAIWANPETRKVLTARQSQTQTKLNAASSIKGTGPKGASHAKQPVFDDRRAALEAAFDLQSGAKKRF